MRPGDDTWHAARVALPGLLLDRADGIGAIPDGAEIAHNGATVLMRPSVYLRLALPFGGARRPASAAFLRTAIREGRPLAPAGLKVDEPDADRPTVWGHDGRHRMEAILEALGDAPVPTQLFRPYRRARHMTDAWLREVSSCLLDERGTNVVEGPLFLAARVEGRTVELHDGTAPVLSRPFLGLRLTRLQADALCLLAEADPALTFGGAIDRFDADGDALAEALEALGHDVDADGAYRALVAAVRGRPTGGRIAAALGPERLARHEAAMAAAGATAPAP